MGVLTSPIFFSFGFSSAARFASSDCYSVGELFSRWNHTQSPKLKDFILILTINASLVSDHYWYSTLFKLNVFFPLVYIALRSYVANNISTSPRHGLNLPSGGSAYDDNYGLYILSEC